MKTPGSRIRTWTAFRPLGAVAVLVAAGLVAAALAAQTSLSDLWVQFPDETVQTTAAHNCFNPADPADEMIRVGGVCIDKYEASVWSSPAGGTQLVTEQQIDGACPDDGQGCKDLIFARSVPNVEPASNITWFQAQAALANSDKRLPTNAEWQMAVDGTPDSSFVCNVDTGSVANTGAGCVSDRGAFDMVGNVWEWVADWVPFSTACPGWSDFGSFSSDDMMCLSGASTTTGGPGALIRGGGFDSGASAGPFAVRGLAPPSVANSLVGFRGAR